jgi:hypothetical protein
LPVAAAFALLVLSGGCAKNPRDSFAKLWDHVPSARWTASKEAEKAGVEEKPTVAANSAAVLAARDGNAADEAKASGEITKEGLKASEASAMAANKDMASPTDSVIRQTGLKGTEIPAKESESTEAAAVVKTTGARLKDALPDPLSTTPVDWAAAFEIANGIEKGKAVAADEISRLGQLRETLEEDAQAATTKSLADLSEFRLRVESLLSHARQQVEAGELKTAQRFARLANELSDGAKLEFSPTEERPQDLLHRIEDLLALSRPETGEMLPAEGVARVEVPATDGPPPLDIGGEPALEPADVQANSSEMAPAVLGSVSANRALAARSLEAVTEVTSESAVESSPVRQATVVLRETEGPMLPPLHLPGVEQLGTSITERSDLSPSRMASVSTPGSHAALAPTGDEAALRSGTAVFDAEGKFEEVVLLADKQASETASAGRSSPLTWLPWGAALAVALCMGWWLARSTGRAPRAAKPADPRHESV